MQTVGNIISAIVNADTLCFFAVSKLYLCAYVCTKKCFTK